MPNDKIDTFLNEIEKSLRKETFVKMTLGNYRGSDAHLQKILIRLIKTKKGTRLFFQYRQDTRDTVKNYAFDEGFHILSELLGHEFFSGHLFTTENDFQLDVGKKSTRLNKGKPTFKSKPPLDHDREKKIEIDQNAFYLKALGITTDLGEIRDKQQDKWKQINKFVEILGGLFKKSSLKDKKSLTIVDMGSGKGYLTFAAYDYFKNGIGLDIKVTGIDTKRELIDLCNEIAIAGEFENLHFAEGTIESYELKETDIMIALHACDTATDDALFKGISANAEIIVAAPCCHKEVRRQMKSPEIFNGILKHGIMLERTAETVTDGLRSMLLERSGYTTKLFEFVATVHTPKNNMIVATRHGKEIDKTAIDENIKAIKEIFSIKEIKLETLLSSSTGAQASWLQPPLAV
ncbi:MAG: SAM-dependent methyltransferase [Pyrinomonadaceae bacterium]